MEKRLTRTFKITLAIFAALLLSIVGVFATDASAEEAEDVAIIELELYQTYEFTPEGYTVEGGELIPHTGSYFLYGDASRDIAFKSNNGEAITYNVTVHNLNAYSEEWYASLGLQYGVTLNLTVQGENSFWGYNHPGVRANESYEGASNPAVNLILEENSAVTFGDIYGGEAHAIDSNLTLKINEGTACSVDMNAAGWNEGQYVEFTNGTDIAHKSRYYYYVDDETCGYKCDDCTDVNYKSISHNKVISALENDSDAETKHGIICSNCSHVFEKQAHNLEFVFFNEESHGSRCKDCQYVLVSTKEAHTPDETNTCTGCGESYTASYTVNGKTKYYFDFRMLLDDLATNGGEVKLLKNYTGDRFEINTPYGENVNITIDLNGFRLEGVRFSNSGSGKITITDTSEAKTGVYSNNTGVTSSNNGTIEYVGITIEDEGICADIGTVIFKDVTVVEKYKLEIYVRGNDAKVELTNVKAQKGLWIKFETSEYNSNVAISGGEFSSVELNCGSYSGTYDINLIDTLAQGYAFTDDNGIINGYTKEVGAVKVIEHGEHTIDVYSDLGATHIISCVCGYTEEGTTGEAHALGENGACVCGVKITAVVNDEFYFGKVSAALKYADDLDGGTVKLINNTVLDAVTIYNDATLNLNGYILSSYGEIDLYGKLTVCDSSEEQSGKMSVSETSQSSYLFDVNYTGTLIINGGEISGSSYLYGYEDEIPSLEVNGGRFIGGSLFYIHNNINVAINGGYFEENRVFYIFYPDRPSNLKIYGGTFVNCQIVNENGLDPQSLLGTIEGCELGYLDVYGNAVTLEMGEEYDGVLTVGHKNSTLVGSEDGHSFYCEACDVTAGLVEHLDLAYAKDENDASKHTVTCGACDYVVETVAHTGGDATCTELASCELCETPYGEPLGHSWVNANCTTPKTCSVCDETEGEALGHSWVNANCTTPKTCSACDETEGEALGHSWVNANCTTPKACSVCNETEGEALGHSYGEDEKCTICGEIKPSSEDEGGLGAGAIVGIVMGSVAVIGGAGVGIWFILKKKRI